jgi:hypothetical protein
MRTWDLFYPYVLPDVLGCPEPLVDQHLIGAAREFCTVTRCWREDLDRIVTRAFRADYDLYFPDGADGVTIIGATLASNDIELDVPDSTTMGERRRGSGGPRRLRTTDMVTVTLIPTPGAGLELRIEAILQPSEAATGMPDAIADRYMRYIAKGAVATLLDMNKQPWTNNGLSDKRRAEFERDMARIKSRVWKGHTNRRPRHTAQFF